MTKSFQDTTSRVSLGIHARAYAKGAGDGHFVSDPDTPSRLFATTSNGIWMIEEED